MITLMFNFYYGFQTYACARGTGGLEGFHSPIANAIAGYAIHPFLFDLLLMDAVFRWNTDRIATFSDTPFYGNNFKLRTDIYKIYTKDVTLFQVNPVIFFKPIHFLTRKNNLVCKDSKSYI